MKKVTNEEFLQMLKIKKPDVELLSNFTGFKNKVLVRDADGIVYDVNARSVITNNKLSPTCAVDKTKLYNIRIKRLFPDLECTEVKSGNKKSVITDKDGIKYFLKPESVLRNHRPTIKAAIDKNKAFEILARKVHKDRYDYSKSEYKADKKKVIITCPIHGDFEQKPNAHIKSKQGCPNCNKARGWTYEEWVNFTEGKECMFYLIKCSNEKESFLKCGISKNEIGIRFDSNKSMPYNYEIVEIVKGTGEFVWKLERKYLKNNKLSKYKPLIKFKGWTECFKLKN